MPKKAGSAKFTAHLAVAIEPVMKDELEAVARELSVDKSVVTRWAVEQWLEGYRRNGRPGRMNLEEVTRT